MIEERTTPGSQYGQAGQGDQQGQQGPDGIHWVAGPPPPPPGSPGGPRAQGDHWTHMRRPGGGTATFKSATGRIESELRWHSPWDLASAAVLVGLAAAWLDSVIRAFQHAPGMTGQSRALLFQAPGTLLWAVGAVLAVGLYAAGRRLDSRGDAALRGAAGGGSPVAGSTRRVIPEHLHTVLPGLLLAAAATSMVCAGFAFLVELTSFGHGIDRAVAGLVGYVGSVVIAGAGAWWANQERHH